MPRDDGAVGACDSRLARILADIRRYFSILSWLALFDTGRPGDWPTASPIRFFMAWR